MVFIEDTTDRYRPVGRVVSSPLSFDSVFLGNDMGVQPLRKVRKVRSSGKSSFQRSIRQLSFTPIRIRPLLSFRQERTQPRPSGAEGLVLSASVVAQASSDQALRPEILAIGRSFMDRYDQALKQLAE